MLQKMGSQMEELLTASKPAAKPARPPTVEGGATPPRMREAESSGSENSDEEVRERRRSPPRRRSLSLDRASGHRSLSPQRPLSEPPPTAPSVGVSNASEPVIDQIGSLALLLEPSGLDGPPPPPPSPLSQTLLISRLLDNIIIILMDVLTCFASLTFWAVFAQRRFVSCKGCRRCTDPPPSSPSKRKAQETGN